VTSTPMLNQIFAMSSKSCNRRVVVETVVGVAVDAVDAVVVVGVVGVVGVIVDAVVGRRWCCRCRCCRRRCM